MTAKTPENQPGDPCRRVRVVGIAGPSGSGKTTLAERLAAAFDGRCVVISEDRYYRDLSRLPAAERERANFDHPDAIDWEALARDLESLREWREARLPVYDFRAHTRSPRHERREPAQLIIVEGILILHAPAVREQMDYSIYLDAGADIMFIRRLRRDIEQRGRTVESVIRQYLETVRPMYEKYVRPTARFADAVLDTGGEVDAGPIERRVREMLAAADGA